MAATGAHLVLDGLAKSYGDGAPAVAALSLRMAKGEMLGLLGPAGAGKTTALRLIGGLTPVTSGRISVAGRDVTALPAYQRDIGFVFQEDALFPHLSVADNVAFGLAMRGMPRDKLAWRVSRVLESMKLATLAGRRPGELSDAQRRRVALARALVIEPSLLLLDEPFGALDTRLREELRGEIRDIQRRQGLTTVLVTHDQDEALALCDRIAVLRGGRLEQIGLPAEIYEQPRTEFVAGFIGRINRLEGERAANGTLSVGALRLRGGPQGAAAGKVTVMVRPHRIAFTDQDRGSDWNLCRGRIRRIAYAGDMLTCEVENDSALLMVERPSVPGAPPLREGETVTLTWLLADTLVFSRAMT